MGQLLLHPLPKHLTRPGTLLQSFRSKPFVFHQRIRKRVQSLDILGYVHPKRVESDHLKATKGGKAKNHASIHLFSTLLLPSVLLRCQHKQAYPRKKPSVGSASNHVWNVSIQTKHLMLVTTQRNRIWKNFSSSSSSHVQTWEIWKYCKLLHHSKKKK